MEHSDPNLTGMDCEQCPEGTYERGTTTEMYDRDGTVFVVRNVPAWVCDTCGDSLVDHYQMRVIERTIEKVDDVNVDSFVWKYGEKEIVA